MQERYSSGRAARPFLAAAVALGAAAASAPLLSGCDAGSKAAMAQSAAAPTPPAAAAVPLNDAIRDAAAVQTAFNTVAQAAGPAVVTITTQRQIPTRSPGGFNNPFRSNPSPFGGGRGGGQSPFGGGGDGDPFEEFFRRFGGPEFRPNSYPGVGKDAPPRFVPTQTSGYVQSGLGSGVIYRNDGLILTNAHVVRGADTVTVKLADGREFRDAKVLGQDARTDLAVVKINANNLPTLPLGDSGKVNVGDWAIAVGNPFSLERTLSVGVISAKAREVPLSESGPGEYLQTDTSINPGNSGGPLLDIYGRVIGINNAIYSRSGGNEGIGFAIPVNTAREIADILVREGRVRRARLGVGITEVADRAAAFGLSPDTKGVLIESVEPNSPASRAGLQPGDVVTSINGQAVTRSGDLQRTVATSAAGSEVTLEVLRGGKTQTVRARVEETKDEAPAGRQDGGNSAPQDNAGGQLGIGIAPLTPENARRLGVQGASGVLVQTVRPGSPADAAGLRAGDVIERVGQTAVANPDELRNAVNGILGRQQGDNKSVALYVNRRGQKQFVVVGIRQQQQ